MRVVHLFEHERGSRYHMMINQGLLQDDRVTELTVNEDVISLGHVVQPAAATHVVQEQLRQAGLIIMPSVSHFKKPYWLHRIAELGLWNRTVIYEFGDWPKVDDLDVRRAMLYVKRTRQSGGQEYQRLLYVGYGLLDEYIINTSPKRDIDVLCLFHEALLGTRNPNEDSRRAMLRDVMDWRETDPELHIIAGEQTTRDGRRSVFEAGLDTPFGDYLRLLKRSKIVITPVPDHGGGDNRLWEAFASGALVMSNIDLLEPWQGFQAGQHYMEIHPLESNYMSVYRDTIINLLANNDVRQQIAAAGCEYALNHHRAVNRVGTILDEAERRQK